MENALVALHASMGLQRLSQAASALPCMRRALSPPLPWTMRTGTRLSQRARPPSPESSGYTRSFLLRAASRAAPS